MGALVCEPVYKPQVFCQWSAIQLSSDTSLYGLRAKRWIAPWSILATFLDYSPALFHHGCKASPFKLHGLTFQSHFHLMGKRLSKFNQWLITLNLAMFTIYPRDYKARLYDTGLLRIILRYCFVENDNNTTLTGWNADTLNCSKLMRAYPRVNEVSSLVTGLQSNRNTGLAIRFLSKVFLWNSRAICKKLRESNHNQFVWVKLNHEPLEQATGAAMFSWLFLLWKA